MRTHPPGPAGLFVGVTHEGAEPLGRQVHVGIGRAHQLAWHRPRRHERAQLVQSRVLTDLDLTPTEPGELGRHQLDGRQRPVDRAQRLPALAHGTCHSDGGSVGIDKKKAGYGAKGAVRIPAPTTITAG